LHSLAFSWDNTHGDWFIYVDGELVDSGSGLNAGDTLQGSGTLVLGQNNGPAGITAPSNNFEGTYYDVRVWNTARSEIEIALNHQRKFDPTALPSDLVANWQMDGFSGTGNNQITNVVNTGADLTIKHATGDGFVAGIPTDFLNIDENTANGSSVGFVVPTDPDEPQNLVNDGLFTSRDTTGHVEEGDTIGGPDGHWLVTNGNIDVIQNAPSPLGGNGLDLIGNQPGAVSQTIATVPGGSYQVVFAVSGNFQQGLNAVELNASAANSSFDYQVDRPDNWTLTDFQWGHRTFTFTADSNTTDLQFKSLNPSAGFFGPVISDVQVIQIPAAVTHALNNDPSLRYDAATGKFYQPVATAVDYDTAAENASLALINGVPGSLVIVESPSENALIHSYSQEIGGNVWLGGSDDDQEGTWVWHDGTTFFTGGNNVTGVFENFNDPAEPSGNGDNLILRSNVVDWDDTTTPSFYIIQWDASEVISGYSFALSDDAGGRFSIDQTSGEITVADGTQLDHENISSHNITVEITDAAGNTYSEIMPIAVNDLVELTQDVPGDQIINEDTVLTFSTQTNNPITVSDLQTTPDRQLQVTVSVEDGVLQLAQGTNTSATHTLQGTEQEINTALDGLTFIPDADFNGDVTLNVSTSLALNLAGHYTFENSSASDQSAGTRHDGIFNGNATTIVDPERGEVLSLDGRGDNVEIQGLFGDPADVTLAAWINQSNQSGNQDIIALGDNIFLRIRQGEVTAIYYDAGGIRDIATGVFLSQEWTHLALTFDDSNKDLRIYMNGEEILREIASDPVIYTRGTESTIGSNGKGTGAFNFSGLVDDARIYTSALSADEIFLLANDQAEVSDDILITVLPLADAPVIDLDANNSTASGIDYRGSFVQALGPVNIADTDTLIFDVDDNAVLSTVTIAITNQLDGPVELLSATVPSAAWAKNYDPASGELVLNAPPGATMDEWAEVIESVQYNNTLINPDMTTRVLEIRADDGTLLNNPFAISEIEFVPNQSPVLGPSSTNGVASVSDYQTALRSITIQNSSENPDTAQRVISWTVNDGVSDSNTISRDVDVIRINDAPTLTSIEAQPAQFIEDGGPVGITGNLVIDDVDDTLIANAFVSISQNFTAGEDVLNFTDQNGISGSYDATTGVLTLTGDATLAQYQTALRTVTYENTSDNPSTLTRNTFFLISDGNANSNAVNREIEITSPTKTVSAERTTALPEYYRLAAALRWLSTRPRFRPLPIIIAAMHPLP